MKPENKPTPLQERLNKPPALVKKEQRLEDVRADYKVVDAVPTGRPKTQADSTVIYVSGGTYRLYVYIVTLGTWHYTALT